jgi:hypothetical protein
MNSHDETIDSGFLSDISRNKELFEQKARFHWQYYSELEYLRSQIYDELKASLREGAHPFDLTTWQRAVKYKYSLVPLSTKGSLADPGGRFNIGSIDPARFPVFPCLYLASDKKTALAELLGRAEGDVGGFTPEELALTKVASITIVSVSGKLESVLDIREPKNLTAFVNLIKNFKPSGKLILNCKRVGITVDLIRTPDSLVEVLQQVRWRDWPFTFDVPAATQIFGRIAHDSGIEGILYRSVLTGSTCLAVYPQNFQNSSACIRIDDDCPLETVHRQIDSVTYGNFV